MKKYLIFLILLVLIDTFVCLSVNAGMLAIEKDYDFYHQSLNELRERNSRLVREAAHLSSLKRVSQLSEKMGLTSNQGRIVSISQDQFAMR